MSIEKIQLDKFLKRENWESHFALSAEPEQEWIVAFREVCSEDKVDADVKGFSCLVEAGKINHFVSYSGGPSDSESKLRAQLEIVISKANKKFCETERTVASK